MFGRAGTEATVFEANKQALLEAIGTTGLRIAIDLRKNSEMEGAIGAYAQAGANGNEIISINADWINAGNLSLEQLTAVALEEYGHALDTRLSQSLESAGDEGELFRQPDHQRRPQCRSDCRHQHRERLGYRAGDQRHYHI